MRYTAIGQNIYAVKREDETIGEVALGSDGICRLIPVEPHVYELDELERITAFMGEVQKRDSDIVVHMSASLKGR